MKTYLTLALLLPALTGTAQVLTNSGAAITVEPGAALYVAGTAQNTVGSTLTNGGTVQLTGDLTNAGTLTSPGLLLFSGTTNQTFSPGTASVTNLTLDNAGAVGQRTLVVPTDLTIGSQLTLLNGLVRTVPVGATTPLGTLTLPAGASVVGEAAGRYVQGNLRVIRSSVGGNSPVAFSNGATLNPQGQNLETVTITRTAGLQTAGLSYGTSAGAKSIDRVWLVESSQVAQPTAATPATLTLSWVSDDDNGFAGSTAQLWRAASAAGPWVVQPATGPVSSRTFAGSIAQLGAYTVGSASGTPLPVTLTTFTATAQGADARLDWATASEKDNDHFDVEASADGHTFRRIGTVAGHGTTLLPQQYQLLDRAIVRYGVDVVYYRLRQVDYNGTASYSPVRPVAVPRQAGLALFPNPTTRAATLTGAPPNAAVTVLDALGRRVLTAQADASGLAPLLLPAGAATGVYLVRVGSQALRLVVE